MWQNLRSKVFGGEQGASCFLFNNTKSKLVRCGLDGLSHLLSGAILAVLATERVNEHLINIFEKLGNKGKILIPPTTLSHIKWTEWHYGSCTKEPEDCPSQTLTGVGARTEHVGYFRQGSDGFHNLQARAVIILSTYLSSPGSAGE